MDYEFVIPAFNEGKFISEIVVSIRSFFGKSARIIVVDNNSSDNTSEIASIAGADEVIFEPIVGKGYAVLAGARASRSKRPFFCDADVRGIDWNIAVEMIKCNLGDKPLLSRLSINRSFESAPVTSLLAKPMLAALGYSFVNEPLGGIFSFESDVLNTLHLPGGWGFDVALTVECLNRGWLIKEFEATGVSHRVKTLEDYSLMASQVALAICHFSSERDWNHDGCIICGCKN